MWLVGGARAELTVEVLTLVVVAAVELETSEVELETTAEAVEAATGRVGLG